MSSDAKKQVPLRLSQGLYAELVRMAEDEFRSVNGQIEFLLTQAVRDRRGVGGHQGHARGALDYPRELEGGDESGLPSESDLLEGGDGRGLDGGDGSDVLGDLPNDWRADGEER